MKRLTFLQGSPEWHAHRATARNASEVSAVLGCSPYMTRTELMHMRHTGIRPDVAPDQQRRYDDGHAIEAAQRPGAALVIGEELYPVVGSEVIDGIELSASFDGLTMAEDVAYECKTINEDLRACMPHVAGSGTANDGNDLPKHYRAQMEQQLMVSGAERILFVAADRDGQDVRRCWYYPDAELRREIIGAWRQFDADLAAYVPPAASAVEKIVAEPVEALPAPVVQVSGQLALQDNFKVFEQRLRQFLDERLIREPKTDQDFADLDAQIKEMKQAREALKAAEAQMLAQVQPVDQAKKTKDMLDSLLQKNVSLSEKILKDEKERRKGDIVAGGVKALADHIAALNARLGRPYMPTVPADFGGAIRGLKSLASMEDKVATELARAKIAASEIADKIETNLTALRELAKDHAFLFADTATLVLKAPDDCRAQIEARIAAHKQEQERRAAELAERERERIRAEEAARADREASERAAAEQRQREEAEAAQRRQEQEAEQAAMREQSMAGLGLETSSAPAAPPATVHTLPARAPAAPASKPDLRLGQINELLAPLSIDDAGLTALGFPPAATDKNAKLRHRKDLFPICDALIAHLQYVQQKALRAA